MVQSESYLRIPQVMTQQGLHSPPSREPCEGSLGTTINLFLLHSPPCLEMLGSQASRFPGVRAWRWFCKGLLLRAFAPHQVWRDTKVPMRCEHSYRFTSFGLPTKRQTGTVVIPVANRLTLSQFGRGWARCIALAAPFEPLPLDC